MFRHCCLSRRRGQPCRASCSPPSTTDQPLHADAMYCAGDRLRLTPPFHANLVFFSFFGLGSFLAPNARHLRSGSTLFFFFVVVFHDSGTRTVSVTPHPSARLPPPATQRVRAVIAPTVVPHAGQLHRHVGHASEVTCGGGGRTSAGSKSSNTNHRLSHKIETSTRRVGQIQREHVLRFVTSILPQTPHPVQPGSSCSPRRDANKVFLIYAGNAKKNAGRLRSSSTRPPFHTIHASVELHFLPRYVARGSITMLWGGLSLSHCPLLLVGSRKVSLSLNATPTRPTLKARFKMAKACLYGGLVTTHSGRRASSPKESENASVVASTWLSATKLSEGKGQAHCRR